MKKIKIINWASVLAIIIIVYQVLSFLIPSIPDIPFGEWQIVPVLGVISVALIGKDIFDAKTVAQQIFDGDFLSVAVILDALQKTNKKIYRRVVCEYREIIKEKMDEMNRTIERKVATIREQFKKGESVSFSVKEQRDTIYCCETMKQTIEDVERGTKTWEDVYRSYIDFERYHAMLKLLLSEETDDATNRAKKDAEIIAQLRRGGTTVNV